MYILTGTYFGQRHYISLWTKIQSVQFKISGFRQPCLVPKLHNHWRPIVGLSNQTFGGHQDHPPTMEVGYLNRFQGLLPPSINTGTVQDISNFMSRVRHTSSKHCLSFHYTHGPNCSSKKLKLMAVHKGIITRQYLDD